MQSRFDPDVLPEDVAEAVEINTATINRHMEEVPGLLAYWNERLAVQSREVARLKAARERAEAALHKQIRADMVFSGAKPTEAKVQAEVVLHEGYQIARERESNAAIEKSRLSGVFEAIRAKKDMLISLGANYRAEMDHEPRIRSSKDR